MPTVMPLRRRPTASSALIVLSLTAATLRRPGRHERVAVPVGDTAEVGLEGETLLEAVAAADVHRVDAVDRRLREADQQTVLGRDLARQLHCGLRQLLTWHHAPHRAVPVQLLGGDG